MTQNISHHSTLSSLQLAYLAKSQADQPTVTEPIAITGIGCRFPGGVNNPDTYWELLARGKSGIVEVPQSRWDIEQYFAADHSLPGKMYSRHGGFIDEPDQFDADFFNIPHREAISLDPQQRLLLEVAWEAIENAGYAPQSLAGVNCGVYVGMFGNDYMVELMSQAPAEIDAYMGIGNFHSLTAGRLSYFLGLHGTSLAVDAACASSLVSVHLACQSLRLGESDLALAGGTHRVLAPEFNISFCKAHMLSPDGQCRAFDDRANGFVRGEGAGIVVLKRLRDAIADGDSIYALIRGSAVNQDGATSSLTVPNGLAQQRVLKAALANAQVTAEQIDYVEAHGTGTPIGDPIEFGALNAVYGDRQVSAPLLLGSVKTNIGHLEGAAGIAGLIKSALALHHQAIPPSLNFEQPNRHINWQASQIEVNTKLQDWSDKSSERFAGVSSFGLNGTNAHIILAAAPQLPLPPNFVHVLPRQEHIMTLSAKNAPALALLAKQYCQHLATQPDIPLPDLCFTTNTGRNHLSHRLAVIGDSVDSLVEQLTLGDSWTYHHHSVAKPKVIFSFLSLATNAKLLTQLYQEQIAFQDAVDECLAVINQLDEASLSFQELLAGAANLGKRSEITSFVVQYAFAQFWRALNVMPTVLAVRGCGAYAAACIAGVFSLSDGLKLVRTRGTADYLQTVRSLNYHQAEWELIDLQQGNAITPDLDYWLALNPSEQEQPDASNLAQLESGILLDCGSRELEGWHDLLTMIARLYVAGVDLDWNIFEQAHLKSRTKLRLPTYQFQRRSYWIQNSRRHATNTAAPSMLHPLVHQHLSSSTSIQSFVSYFDGSEFFFQDHQVYGQKLLPATAYLSMVRAGAALSSPAEVAIELGNIVWQQAIKIEQTSQDISLQFTQSSTPQVREFVVASKPSDRSAFAKVIHARGEIKLAPSYPTPPSNLNLESIQTSLTNKIDREGCQALFAKRDVNYGEQFQALAEISWSGNCVLGRLSLPDTSITDSGDFILHPGLLDSALQCTVAFAEPETFQPYLPLTLERIKIYAALEAKGYVVGEKTTSRKASAAGLEQYNFTITDLNGRILAQLKGLTVKQSEKKAIAATNSDRVQNYVKKWQLSPLSEDVVANGKQPSALLLFDDETELAEVLRQNWSATQVVRVKTAKQFEHIDALTFGIDPLNKADLLELLRTLKRQNISSEYIIWRSLNLTDIPLDLTGANFHALVGLGQALTTVNPGLPSRLSYLVENHEAPLAISQLALCSLFKTQNKEDIRRSWQVIQWQESLSSKDSRSKYASLLCQELRQTNLDFHVCYDPQGNRTVPSYEPVEIGQSDHHSITPIRQKSVVVISGGSGGLGRTFAQHLCTTYNSQVILLGRSQPNSTLNSHLAEINAQGNGSVEYRQADICNLEELQGVLASIRDHYGSLQGIIHSAAVIKDSLLVNKTSAEFEAVLAPKCQGVFNLDLLTQADPLDFFAIFSSLAAEIGNLGQADYSYSNAFLDNFARWRDRQNRDCQREGRTVSFNWPAWTLGLGVNADVAARLRRETGLGVMSVAEGIRAFERGLKQTAQTQVLVFAGDTAVFEAHLQRQVKYQSTLSQPAEQSDSDQAVRLAIIAYIKNLFSTVLKIPVADIDLADSWDKYHLDSIMVLDLTRRLELKLGELPKTLLFEYSSFNNLVNYILSNFAEQFVEIQQTDSGATDRPNRVEQQDVEMDADEQLERAVETRIRQIFASILQLSLTEIAVGQSWDTYHIDSIMMLDLTHQLEKLLDTELPKTLLFEHQSIEDLIGYLWVNHDDQLRQNVQSPLVAEPAAIDADLKNMTLNLEEISDRTDDYSEKNRFGDIAIIGVSGRYPQADNLEEFWQNLKTGRDCITEIPSNRWDLNRYFASEKGKEGKTYSKWGGFIDHVDKFDPLFFNISPREAEIIDPQERLFLQCAYHTIEDAGYTRASLNGDVGVYVGVMYEEYQLYGAQADTLGQPVALKSSAASIANRVSYCCNFHGPSIAVDTMCSSSLTSVQLACQSLQTNQCSMAIAGGVNLSLHPNKYLLLGQGQFASTDGRCRSFGAGGNGYVPGEGVGAVLLRPLADAVRDGDRIYGVIKAATISHGGKSSGYTVPNPQAQADVIAKTFASSGLDPRTIGYIEAHGTGTSLGDPIEISGLNKAFERYTQDNQFCAIGSVKSNIGHCESAAGIAAITKVLLQFKHKQIVPSLHSERLNPYIDFANSPFVVQQQLSEWKCLTVEQIDRQIELPRRAGISSFGAGGANAHLIIEEWQDNPQNLQDSPPLNLENRQVPFILSANTEERLHQLVRNFQTYIAGDRQQLQRQLEDVVYTLQVGREAMNVRLAIAANSIQDWESKLAAFLAGEQREGVYSGSVDLTAVQERSLNAAEFSLDDALASWVKGSTVDWQKYRGATKPQPISLPGYPFLLERYWFDLQPFDNNQINSESLEAEATVVSSSTTSTKEQGTVSSAEFDRESSTVQLFEEYWHPCSLSPQAIAENAPNQTLVCFLSDRASQHRFRTAINTLNPQARLIFVAKGVGFSQLDSDRYQINAKTSEDYQLVLQKISSNYGGIDAVCYLWATDNSEYYSNIAPIVLLLQSISAGEIIVKRCLLGGFYEPGLTSCYLESWLGFERSIKRVLPSTPVVGIFIENALNSQSVTAKIDDLAIKLWQECQVQQVQSVLYRQQTRHINRVRSLELAPASPDWQTGRTYLITGGLGELGFLFAQHLAKSAPGSLILTGRSALNSARQSRMKILQNLGASVCYIQADVSDRQTMESEIKRAKANFGKINGVIHAAGLMDNRSLLEKNLGKVESVLQPKIAGTIILDELLAADPLDFTCYCSSSSAVLGDFGSCDYAISNRFQTAYAKYKNRSDRKYFAIEWPLWSGGGMHFAEEQQTYLYLKSSGQRLLEPAEGLDFLDRAIALNHSQYLMLVGQPEKINHLLELETTKPSQSSAPTTKKIGRTTSRLELKGLSLEQCIAWDIANYSSEILKLAKDRLTVNTNFADFGFDSVSLAELAQILSQHYGFRVAPSVFFDCPTISKLTQYFLTRQQSQLENIYFDKSQSETPISAVVEPEINPAVPSGDRHELPRQYPSPKLSEPTTLQEPIAIIGMSGRFPQARNIDEMWEILVEGKNAVTEIASSRFDWQQYYGTGDNQTNSKWCGTVPGVKEFDPLFFEISPREAKSMDPRQRLLLQESWNALEDAGYGQEQIQSSKIGMFVGVEQGDYQLLSSDHSNVTANHDGVLAARLAYFLNLSGPVMALNTACSSGLLALHQACLSLRSGECDTALAAAVNLILTPDAYISLSRAGMLSDDGKCFTFDRRANGMVPGEAVVAVTLKPLAQAKRDGDPIYGIVRGSGISYDGKTNGITAPSGISQSSLIRDTYQRYGISPEEIDYVIAHGTGTRLGDPVEINALNDVFQETIDKKGYCALTSTKTNFGHTFAASGIVSLISLVQSLQHQTIPPSLHCTSESEYIDWQNSPFFVNKQSRVWSKNSVSHSRMGAVSAFGMSGTNVHVVVEEYVASSSANNSHSTAPYYLLAFSAKTEMALTAKIEQALYFLETKAVNNLAQLAHTLLLGRQHFDYRCAVVIEDREDAIYALGKLIANESRSGVFTGKVPRDFTSQSIILNCAQTWLNELSQLVNLQEQYCERLFALADFYCQGYELDWKSLFGDDQPVRIHLPTYPFAREKYWVDGTKAKVAVSLQSKPLITSSTQKILLEPVWNEKPSAIALNNTEVQQQYRQYLIIDRDLVTTKAELTNQLTQTEISILSSQEIDWAQSFQDYATQVFNTLQNILKSSLNGTAGVKKIVQVVLPIGDRPELFTALSALLKTAQLEQPGLLCQLIETDVPSSIATLTQRLRENHFNLADRHIRYHSDKRYVRDWQELANTELLSPSIPWQDRGVYIITGGIGGLGLIIAQEIAQKSQEATLILVGRSEPNNSQQKALTALTELGAKVQYFRVDVTDQQAVTQLISEVTAAAGKINAIVHGAGIIQDKPIVNKTAQELQAVLAPKVTGAWYFDQATQNLKLDFFLLFSSVAGVLGNAGQSDYAIANAFLDCFAQHRNSLVSEQQRYGHTLSINWCFWQDGGMKVNAATKKAWQQAGIALLDTNTGLQTLYHGLEMKKTQLMILAGEPNRLRKWLATRENAIAASNSPAAQVTELKTQDIEQQCLTKITALFSEVTELPVERIDTAEPLESYGIDSMLILQLNQKLETVFANVPKTLFYEYKTLETVAKYFLTEQPDACQQLVCSVAVNSQISQADIAPTRQKRNQVNLTPTAPTSIPEPTTPSSRYQGDIAIIGLSGSFPQADTLDLYWDNLRTGQVCLSEIPTRRWSLDNFYEADKSEALRQALSYCRIGGFVENFDRFDPLFFKLSPLDAYNIDPQERLMLTSCWSAMEDSGYSRQTLQQQYDRSVGVFIGVTKLGFNLHTELGATRDDSRLPHTSFSSMANRVSYQLDLVGPSMAIDTMCASSLTALHEACEHIRRGDCQLALAGSVNLYLHPRTYIDLCQGKLLTDENRVECFSATGKGFIPGEGVGAAVLKPLERAIADGDRIYGVIKASSVNHSGRTHGYSVPSVDEHCRLIEQVLERAGYSTTDIDYVEAAANGSSMGDAIELKALERVFKSLQPQSCYLSTVKPNIGHLEAASGFSQLIKVLYQFKHQTLAPTLNCSTEALADSPFQIQTEAKTWQSLEMFPHRTLITSHGAGGASAALVVESYNPPSEPEVKLTAESEANLFVLSARNEAQLTQSASRLRTWLENNESTPASVACTLQVGRDAMKYRLAIVAQDKSQLLKYLDVYQSGNERNISAIKTGTKDLSELKAQMSLENIQQEVAQKLVARDLSSLGSLWVQGWDEIDWHHLYQLPVKRCGLPTYPFEQRSFWYKIKNSTVSAKIELEEQPNLEVKTENNQQSLAAVESLLISAIKEILLLEESDHLATNDSFVDLGLDSISATRFIQKLSQKLQLSLRETLVFDYPSIGELAAYISSQQPRINAPEIDSKTTSCQNRFQLDLKAAMQQYPSIVPLQIAGDGEVLFCLPPMSGDVGVYQKIATAAESRFKTIGLKSQGLLDWQTPLSDIESMGIYFAKIIADLNLKQIHLLGASMGGAVAYETARNLIQHQIEVKTLFLVEAPLINCDHDASLWQSDAKQNLVMNANFLLISLLHMNPEFRQRKAAGEVCWQELEIREEEVPDLAESETIEVLSELIQTRGINQSKEMLGERLKSMAEVHLANLQALRNYRPRPLSNPNKIKSILLRTQSGDATSNEVYNPAYLLKVQQSKGSMLPFLSSWNQLFPNLSTKVISGANHFDLISTRQAAREMATVLFNAMEDKLKQPLVDSQQIAIVGMSGRFPGADSLQQFWEMLSNSSSSIGDVPQERGWNIEDIYDPTPQANKTYIRQGGFLSATDYFDPAFFQISPKEAEMMDVAERMFLEECWKALEDAGISPTNISGRKWGVFCGSGSDYTLRLKDLIGISPHVTQSSIPGRVAYSLNLTGPTVAVDAACASSSLAIAQACDHLVWGKCEAALAGGVMVHCTPNLIVAGCQNQLFSRQEKGKALDADADGMIPGEAIGVVVLKTLSKAIESGDRIYGVIEAWGNNHNGRTNGMAAPSGLAQTELLTDIYHRFKIDPATITMMEANATGTSLGDRIEVESLTDAFREFTSQTGYCSLGTVENNIGHAFQGSGMGHVFKVLLALKHNEIPPTANIEQANPAFKLENTPFEIDREPKPWHPQVSNPRRAAVSSFGSTGTNVHLVIAEPPTTPAKSQRKIANSSALICLSAKTEAALRRRCQDLITFVGDRNSVNLTRLSANLLLRRSHFDHRLAIAVDSTKEFIEQLKLFLAGQALSQGFSGFTSQPISAALQSWGQDKLIAIERGTGARQDLLILADLYTQGGDLSKIDFLDRDKLPLSLPTYPFERRWCSLLPAVPDSSKQQPLVKAEAKVTSNTLEILKEILASTTGYTSSELDIHASFAHYGIDSLMSMRLLNEINERFEISLQLDDLQEQNTLLLLEEAINQLEPENKPKDKKNSAKIDSALPATIATLPSYLQHYCLSGYSQLKTTEWHQFENIVAEITQQGIAVFHDGLTCHFFAHNSIDIQTILQGLTEPKRQVLTTKLPTQALLAPVSQEQTRSLYHSEILEQAAWNIQHIYQVFAQDLQLDLLNLAMQYVVANHDLLRTRFAAVGNTWVQIIEPEATVAIQTVEMNSLSDFTSFIADKRNCLLPLDRLPIIKVWLSSIQGQDYLGFVTHHCLADAFTTSMLFAELMDYYHALARSQEVSFKTIGEQYWQYGLQKFDAAIYKQPKTKAYWSQQLAGMGRATLNLPYANAPDSLSPQEMSQSAVHLHSLSPSLTQKINDFNRVRETTVNHLFTTAIAIWLTQICGNSKALVQLMTNQRQRMSLVNTLGDFTNPLFVPLQITKNVSLLDTLQQIKTSSLKHLSHDKINFWELLLSAGLSSYDDYFALKQDIVINSANLDLATSSTFHGRSLYADSVLQLSNHFQDPVATALPSISTLFYQILQVNGELHLITGYRRHLFVHSSIEEMSEVIIQCLEQIISNPGLTVKELVTEIKAQAMPSDIAIQPPANKNAVAKLNSPAILPKHSTYPLKNILRQNSTSNNNDATLLKPKSTKSPIIIQNFSVATSTYSELQRLNQVKQGRPVFWFHGGLGGVESYRTVAASCPRPFYGINARGWMSDREPLYGIETMAAYYISIMRSVEPQGSYDLGGFSLGGMIAYEVTRQLQQEKQAVNSIVMIDTLDSQALTKVTPQSAKTFMLQAANLFLLSSIAWQQQQIEELGITYSDLDFQQEDQAFLEQLVNTLKARGIKLAAGKLKELIQKVVAIQSAYQLSTYQLKALAHSEQPTCYYLRNQKGLFLGNLSPYFTSSQDELDLNLDNYWETWHKQFDHFILHDLNSSSHMSMMLDLEINQEITAFCQAVYHN